MKRLEKLSMVAVMLLLSVTMAFAQQKPNIHILATGGTIAGTGVHDALGTRGDGGVGKDAVVAGGRVEDVDARQLVKLRDIEFALVRVTHGGVAQEVVLAAGDVAEVAQVGRLECGDVRRIGLRDVAAG